MLITFQKTEEEILKSILNLLKQIKDRSSFFSDISRLFATLVERNSRMLLADIFLVWDCFFSMYSKTTLLLDHYKLYPTCSYDQFLCGTKQ